MTHMIMDEGEDSKGKSVKTDLSLVLNMFSFQSHFVCAKKNRSFQGNEGGHPDVCL